MKQGASSLTVGSIAFLLCSVFWGLNIPLHAELFKAFDPFWVSPNRYMIASLLLGTWVLVAHGPRALGSPIPVWRVLMLSLFVSSFLTCYALGMYLTHPVTAAAVSAGSPIYVAVVSRVWTGTRLERGFWGAMLLTLVGAAIAISGRAGASAQGLQFRGGEILIVIAIVCWTVYSVLAQRWFTPATSQLQRTWLSSIGAVPWLFAFWAIAHGLGLVGQPNLQPDGKALVDLTMSAVFCTALATVAWNTGVGRLGVAVGGMWQNTVPVFAVLISMLFYNLVPTGQQVIGGALVLCGVIYLQWTRYQGARRTAQAAQAPAGAR